jgi:hypothetical protein
MTTLLKVPVEQARDRNAARIEAFARLMILPIAPCETRRALAGAC